MNYLLLNSKYDKYTFDLNLIKNNNINLND